MSSKALRIIAACTMVIDHIGEIFVRTFSTEWYILRGVGRIAFPIFCFLIAEGYAHTHSLKKYYARMLAFATVSELAYDLCFHNTLFYRDKCSVYVTLLLGLTAITIADKVIPNILSRMKYTENICKNKNITALISIPAVAACFWAAERLGSDYGGVGVAIVFAFYLFRENRALSLVAFAVINAAGMCMSFSLPKVGGGLIDIELFKTIQWAAPAACLPLALYNGKPGVVKHRYFFYVFYPAHLILLWLASTLINH